MDTINKLRRLVIFSSHLWSNQTQSQHVRQKKYRLHKLGRTEFMCLALIVLVLFDIMSISF